MGLNKYKRIWVPKKTTKKFMGLMVGWIEIGDSS
jgi:hypothetical protein